ncbi:UDP-N-acetylglucosamine--N-acetylmuramyl-(pentapeptide) pyrophosphoryl-undecaprenol N-acetylglucosamine transferase [Luteimonas sp. RD2P54]|uniref:UDP-N-acetylglucosamine--N-acetylmuramyl-(pentapeptide) pyrophosphoryl-undecaprenol N-acetylglucosamine transferase n=1 Tax=Luteimonas endophytica TaxID=3042023 RepID=A0ABT6JDM4_9GAMM|nr:UDP-N-acetylglucosamine--N-acetylmuramyl-(pentapeptide) pyrophosphoryl-undecaprenol N-acetylglucosamine transferase [Luteimonas endophytica]MDH5824921.1 UDP-N-acetylglucosamine--N-acetylmuramyl-(pentapeptide) pyrophosphoryl-undecaprenol N-acetylglucosamine transferase [Luteimonas endophytica]
MLRPTPPPATIALAAGGTGGHLFPAEALARELLARGHAAVIYTERRGAAYTQALEGLPHVVLPARSLAGGIGGKLAAVATIARAASQARRDLKRRGAALMVGFGGYPSFAPALAARSLGLPLLLHEQATRLSLANRQLLRFASGVATSFPGIEGAEGFDPARIVETGNPVRRAILEARAPYPPLAPDAPLRLLVVGGSQSARVFGEIVPPALLMLPEPVRARLRLALQYKGEDAGEIAARLAAAGIHAEVQPFFDDMGARLRDAHLVITRAGATTAADLLTVGRPAILVPIPQGGSRLEQRRNAEALAAAGVGWCLPEPELSAQSLAEMLDGLFAEPARLQRAAQAAAALGRPGAAAALADLVERMLAGRPPAAD